MELTRSWLGQSLRAAAVTALAPAAALAAAAVVALGGGGLGGLGSLGQIVSGPELPGAEGESSGRRSGGASRSGDLEGLLAAASSALPAAGGGVTGLTGITELGPPGAGTPGAGTPGGGSPGGSPTLPGTLPGPGGGGGSPGGGGGGGGVPQVGPVQQLGDAVNGALSPLPPPVSGPVSNVVDSVVQGAQGALGPGGR